ncbi:MAG: ABC transporter substrate-binding protein [Candidatus Woesebacteria bacterium]|jgi:peptide/nickel transport system substrate-binding protein
MRKIYWYLTTYAKKHGFLLFASLLFAIIFFSLIIPFTARKITIKKKEYIAVIGEYNLHSLPSEIKQVLSLGLTNILSDKTVNPLLVERWSLEDDEKTYRFIIKKNIQWQDGKDLVPEDVKYNFRDVETIYTANDVIFKLPEPFAPFPSIVSEPIFREAKQKHLLFFERPTLIGIGNAKILDYKKKANRLEELVIDLPEKRLIYRFYLTEADAILAFKRGEVDILNDIITESDLYNWSNIEVEKKIRTNKYLAVFFNNSDPVLAKNIRQALAYAISKPEGEERALGPIDPESWVYLEGGKSYRKDLDRAVERILDALPPEKMDLKLTTTISFIKEAEQMKKEWEEFGQKAFEACQNSDDVENKDLCENIKITVNIKVTNFPDTADFQLLLLAQESPTDPDQYFLWHSSQPTNLTKYKNTRIDSLLEKGRKTIEQKDRLAVYQEFQQFLLEDPPAIFLRHLESYDVKRK